MKGHSKLYSVSCMSGYICVLVIEDLEPSSLRTVRNIFACHGTKLTYYPWLAKIMHMS